jgi:hypothetical protein
MAAASEVVELIGMETKGAIGSEVERYDAYRCTSKEKRSSRAGMQLGGQR